MSSFMSLNPILFRKYKIVDLAPIDESSKDINHWSYDQHWWQNPNVYEYFELFTFISMVTMFVINNITPVKQWRWMHP